MDGLKVSEELLGVLKANGDWMAHADIARVLGKRRLDAGRCAALKVLAWQGVIEIRHTANSTPIGYRLEYRYTTNSDARLQEVFRGENVIRV